MSDPIIGLVFRRQGDEARPAVYADLSTAGLIGPMPDADPAVFPLNTPVKGYTNDSAFLKAMGSASFVTDGMDGINQQLGELQRSAQVIVVRTAPGVDADPAIANQKTIANIVGSSAAGTGMWAFTFAPELCQATPRLIGFLGYTGILASTVGTVTRTKAGKGYVNGDQYALTFTSGGGANVVQATGYAVGQPDGTLGPAILTSPGQWYATAPTVTAAAPPAGADVETATYTAAIDALANPICASAPAVLNELLAHAVVESTGVSQAQDEAWRETINSDRLIPVVGGCKVTDADGNVVTRPFASRVIGAIIRRDHETGAPFHSACNQPIYGIVGPARRIRFALTYRENEGQSLLAANMGILVPGELGNDFAIASGGFIFLGTDNAGEDELWRFYNQTRGRDFIHLTLLRMMRYYLGRFNVTYQTLNAIINGMKYVLRDLKADENILGYRVTFTGTSNSAEEIRKGNITVDFAAEEPAPLRKITTISRRMRSAVDALVTGLEAQLNLAA